MSGSVWQPKLAGSDEQTELEEKGLLGANCVWGRAGRRARARGRRRAARRRTGRCLWTRNGNKCCRCPWSCTSTYVTQWVVDKRTGRSGRTAKTRAGEHRCCRDAGGSQNFASTVGRQFMFQTEHWDIFRMTSTRQPCRSAGGRFQLSLLFFLWKPGHAHYQLIHAVKGAVLWTDSCKKFAAFFINISFFFYSFGDQVPLSV